MVVTISVTLWPLSETCYDRDKLIFQKTKIFDCSAEETCKKLYIKFGLCSPNKKGFVHMLFQELREMSFFFLSGNNGHKQQTSHLRNPMSPTKYLKLLTDSLIFRDTTTFWLLGTVTVRFATSGEIMAFPDLVEVGFNLSLQLW